MLYPGLLGVGGYSGDNYIFPDIEFWSPAPRHIQCTIPVAWADSRAITLDFVQGRVINCALSQCEELTKTGWKTVASTLEFRRFHTSAVISGQGILLVGGDGSKNTTEIVPIDGGVSRKSFPLETDRFYHCSIQVSDTTIVLTGGGVYDNWYVTDTLSLVTEYSGLGTATGVVSKELPELLSKRANHACGMYTLGSSQVNMQPYKTFSTHHCRC